MEQATAVTVPAERTPVRSMTVIIAEQQPLARRRVVRHLRGVRQTAELSHE
jgi:hypothetical protein